MGCIPHEVLPSGYSGARHYATAIYFLLPQGSCSHLHRILADEMWHFYLGDPLILVQISPQGQVDVVTLGHDIAAGQRVQHVVPGGYWFGAMPAAKSNYALVGCTVSPGFDFADFELGERQALLQAFPQARDWIEQLTPPDGVSCG